MRDVPHDTRTTGEVIARAPWLTSGYLKNPEGSADLWRDGWLHTGDVGHMSPDGTLRITDRLKDVIKSGGEWVSSLTLENLASMVPGVREVAAVGVPDDRWGERPVLVVVLDGADQLKCNQGPHRKLPLRLGICRNGPHLTASAPWRSCRAHRSARSTRSLSARCWQTEKLHEP